jgi:hypothetical protein
MRKHRYSESDDRANLNARSAGEQSAKPDADAVPEGCLMALTELVRLLARQLARDHFAGSTQQNQSKDQSGSSDTGGKKDE